VAPDDFRVATAVGAVRHLAGRVGPRHGTSQAYRRAARWVQRQLEALGYDVRQQPFQVPGGTSWGVPVRAGPSTNVIAEPPGFDPRDPHFVVGAHLDTVPQAPGAEDNASGVGVLLAVAEAISDAGTRLPVRLVAFGAEEPRGPGDDDHHYGSRHYVSQMGRVERRALRAMLSLDRVGVGTVMPVCSAGGPTPQRAALMRAARRAGVAAFACGGNRASDHWSFVRNGLPGTRLGSTPYAAYHSAEDLPSVVNRAQLGRAGRVTLAWLAGPAAR
jgi:aminopeptidase YwaD